jgi:hypothetical protein
MDFIEVSKIIFENKSKYKTITDKEKYDAFYIINKKLSLGINKNKKSLLSISQFFNHKSIDKISALDLWFFYLKDFKSTPGFWFAKNPNKKEEKVKSISKADREMLMEYDNLTEKDFDFLCEHYKDDVEYRIKILNRV